MLQRLKRTYASHARRSADDVLGELCANVHAGDGAMLLDVGCGTGATTIRLADACEAPRRFGLDGYLPAAREALTHGIRVGIADFETGFPFRSNAFDVVILNQVIEHIRDLDGFVAEVARVLKRGAHLLVSTPNLASWTNIAALVCQQQAFSQSISSKYYLGNRFSRAYKEPVPYEFPQHCHILTSRGLTDLLELNGLTLLELRGAGYFPLPDIPMTRLDPGHSQYLVARAMKRA